MSVAVQVDNDILEMAIGHYEKSGEGSQENVFNFTDGPGEDESIFEANPMQEYALEMAEELLSDGVTWFDEAAKARGLSGLGSIDPATYSKIGFMIAKKRIPTEWLENSPETVFILMTTKILAKNGMELQRIKNQTKGNEQN